METRLQVQPRSGILNLFLVRVTQRGRRTSETRIDAREGAGRGRSHRRHKSFTEAPSLSLSERSVEAAASELSCAWACVRFPHGCSRSPLNKTVVPLLSKPTSAVSNERLPGSSPTTAGSSVSRCQQPTTLIRCFITPKGVCVCVCSLK